MLFKFDKIDIKLVMIFFIKLENVRFVRIKSWDI
jgi:hypothetical protein